MARHPLHRVHTTVVALFPFRTPGVGKLFRPAGHTSPSANPVKLGPRGRIRYSVWVLQCGPRANPVCWSTPAVHHHIDYLFFIDFLLILQWINILLRQTMNCMMFMSREVSVAIVKVGHC